MHLENIPILNKNFVKYERTSLLLLLHETYLDEMRQLTLTNIVFSDLGDVCRLIHGVGLVGRYLYRLASKSKVVYQLNKTMIGPRCVARFKPEEYSGSKMTKCLEQEQLK